MRLCCYPLPFPTIWVGHCVCRALTVAVVTLAVLLHGAIAVGSHCSTGLCAVRMTALRRLLGMGMLAVMLQRLAAVSAHFRCRIAE